jgi:3-methyladenine DNA glycosylase AlkD
MCRALAGVGDHAALVREAEHLVPLVDDPARVTRAQMDAWAADFDSWDLCDQACSNLFSAARPADAAARAWCRRDEEYVKRAAFALVAAQAVHDTTVATLFPGGSHTSGGRWRNP